MPYDDPYRRPRTDGTRQSAARRGDARDRSAGRSSGQAQRSRSTNGNRSSRQQGRAGNRAYPNGSNRQHRSSQIRGLSLGSRPLSFTQRLRRLEPRAVGLLVAIVVLVIIAIFFIGSCVSSCSSPKEEEKVNAIDARVSANASEEVTNKFTPTLDRNEKLAWIAQNADRYDDTTLIDLALAQPDAIDFVAAYPDSEKTAQEYSDLVTQAHIPELYDWDSRWGGVSYDGHPLAVTGSGPTAVTMAYMGLTGNSDQTPATIAELATTGGFAGGDSHLSSDFIATKLADMGLDVQEYTSSDSNVTTVLDVGTYLLVEAKADGLTKGSEAHWVVAYTENEDGTVQIYDPTDPSAATHEWSSATIANVCDNFYAVKKSATSDDGTNAEDVTGSSSSETTTSSSN